jgi:hypothetical protein
MGARLPALTEAQNQVPCRPYRLPSVRPQVEVGFGWLSDFLISDHDQGQIQGQMRDLPLNLRPRGKAFASRGRDM